jgi:hydroxymethylpyrimidine/phosphomethylpyrimidine kinase
MCKHSKYREVGQADNKEKLTKPLQLLTTNLLLLEATRNLAILLKSMPLEQKQQFKNNMKKFKLISLQNLLLKNKKTLKEWKLKTKEILFNLKWKLLRINKIIKDRSKPKRHHRTGSSFKYVLTASLR